MFTIHLFTEPAYMLAVEEDLTIGNIINLRQELNDNLSAVESVITKLTEAGFKNTLLKYSLEFWREDIFTPEQAMEEVKKLELPLELFDFGLNTEVDVCSECGGLIDDDYIETEWDGSILEEDEGYNSADDNFWLN